MSDSKISDLAAATTPLAGTELLPLVQGGATKRVAASDVGRLYTAGGGLQLVGAEFSARAPLGDPNRAVFWEDFLGSVNSLMTYVEGSGAVVSILQGEAASATGVARFETGTSTTGRAAATWPHANSAAAKTIYFGSGAAVFSSRLRVETLSDGTNTFAVRVGFTSSPMSDDYYDAVDGLYFQYNPAARGNHNWWIISRNNYTAREVDSGVAASASAYQVLQVEVNAAATEVVSRIDGAAVDTNTTNIPSGSSRRTGWGAGIRKTAGTTNRRMLVDWFHVDLHFPSGRP